MKYHEFMMSPIARRVYTVTTGATLVALVPIALSAQASHDSSTATVAAGASTAASVATAVVTDQPISMCIVPGSGTAYRVGGPGLPTQCLAVSHTMLTLNLTGPQGLQGVAGAKGDSGAMGPMGAKGDAGAVGPVGPQGAAGVDGAVGEMGPMGPAGANGEAGAAGAAGAPGVNGTNGVDGAPGTPGINGTNGTDGAPGVIGPSGAPGLPGAMGPAGAPGAMGPQGEQGIPGTSGDHSALTNLTIDSHPQYLLAGERVAPDGFLVSGTLNAGTAIPSAVGTRLVWNPRKGAFRAGGTGDFWGGWWNDAEVGYYSAAFGLNNRASGEDAFAVGSRSTASGRASFASGIEGWATGEGSAALGGRASGYGAFAVGNMAFASGHVTIALGQGANASGSNATAIGRSQATGNQSVVMGTGSEASGEQSIAIGNNARTDNHRGSVVIGAGYYDMMDNLPHVFSTEDNQFMVRAAGGFVFYTEPYLGAGVTLSPGGGSWNTLSDRHKKTDFRDIDGETLLTQLRRVPVTSWTYKAQDQSVRHIGPMAQDWEQTFGLSRDSTTINSGDIAGVTLAGVQALETRTSVTAQHIMSLEQRVRELEAQLQELLQVMRTHRDTSRPE